MVPLYVAGVWWISLLRIPFFFLCINLDLYVPNQLCTTSCEFFWPRGGNSLGSYHHVLSEPHLRTDLWAEFVAVVSAIDKTAWVVKRLLYSFLMVQVTLSHRILHSSVSATAVMEILRMLVHRHHCTTSRHHLFRKAVDAYILHSFMGRNQSPPKFCVFWNVFQYGTLWPGYCHWHCRNLTICIEETLYKMHVSILLTCKYWWNFKKYVCKMKHNHN